MMKFALALLMISGLASAASLSQEEKLFNLKEKFNEKAYELKVIQEKEIMKIQNKSVMDLFEAPSTDMSCVEFVYKGPGTRQEAIEACRGVYSVECVEFVYQGPGTRIEAAHACRGVTDMECVRFAYQGPGSRIDAARACSDRRPPRPNDCR